MEVSVNKEILETKKRGFKMGMPLKTTSAEYTGENVIAHLTGTLHISNTMLAALLEVTERTLTNWRDQPYEELRVGSKSKRLIALYNFVSKAAKKRVPENLLINLLQEPVNEADEESKSVLFYIVNEPESKFFNEASNLLIDQFLK
jgi:vacuolar-type H+-ATPase subunit E/Vma4